MKCRSAGISGWPFRAAVAVFVSHALATAGGVIRPVSVADPSRLSAGGNGPSGAAIISPDGRYVLFSSSAVNLVAPTNAAPVSGLLPPALNVFLRDRTNGVTTLISVNAAGTGGGNGDSFPTGISTNGRYALFESAAANLVAGDTNNASDVFVRDTVGGVTLLVSAGASGAVGNGASRSSVMTPDGHYVAFVSAASNLVAFDTNHIPDVFVHDLWTGSNTLVSVGAISTNSAGFNSSSESPVITPDGRYVAFSSTATNLTPDAATGGDIYVRDLTGGATVCASTDARQLFELMAGGADLVAFNQAISDDGQFIAFETCTNAALPALRRGMVFRFNRQTGLTDLVDANAAVPAAAYGDVRTLDMSADGRFIAFAANVNGVQSTNTAICLWDAQDDLITLVSGDSSSGAWPGGVCWSPVIDGAGRYVAFLSTCANLVTNTLSEGFHLFWRDTQAQTLRLVDIDTNGAGAGVGPTLIPGLSADGASVVFNFSGGSLVSNDFNHADDVFVRDVAAGRTELISARNPTFSGQAPNSYSILFASPVSTGGRYVAFASDADNLAPGDTNSYRDVFVRDLLPGTNILVSMATNGGSGSAFSSEPSMSADGRYVAFSSFANNLAATGSNKAQQVFVRDLRSGTTALGSVNTSGTGPGTSDSYSPLISSDGRYLLFRSLSKDLTSSYQSLSGENLFLRDLQSASNYALTYAGVTSASMTPDGRYVACVGALASTAYLYVWDSQAAKRVYTNNSSMLSAVSISPGGKWLVYSTGSGTSWTLGGYSLAARTNWTIATNTSSFGSFAGLRFSDDERFLVYATSKALSSGDTNQTSDVLLFDFLAGTNLLISRDYNSTRTPNAASDSPGISPDGRFIAFRSAASNCVPNDPNNVPDLFLFDRRNDSVSLLSVSQSGDWSANNRSAVPIFSPDSQTLLFQSWAGDLAAGEFSQGNNVFALSLYPSNAVYPFSVAIVRPAPSSLRPTLIWPAVSGKTYGVQFKDNLNDPWQDLDAEITYVGGSGYTTDLAPAAGRRFYRIVVGE